MKKNYWFLYAVFFFLFFSCSSPEDEMNEPPVPETAGYTVSLEEAEKELLGILDAMQDSPTRSPQGRKIAGKFSLGSPAGTRGATDEPYVHVFNFEGNEGFAMMSGDKRMAPLLALTFDGQLDPAVEIDNPGLAIFLTGLEGYYERQVAQAQTRISPGGDDGMQEIDLSGPRWNVHEWVYTAPRMGYCSVEWGQGDLYNLYCPVINGERAYTGCVPTSVAQLMAMYRQPASYNGYSFNWAEMTQYEKPYTSTAQAQVSRLMQQLGLPANLAVSYGSDDSGSGASADNNKRTLNNFGYSSNDRQGYNSSKIGQELLAGYPCLVGGFDIIKKTKVLGITVKTVKTGHQWLVHGLYQFVRRGEYLDQYGNVLYNLYDSTDYVLCNMGWDGSKSDGYYLSGVFDAATGPRYTRSEVIESSGTKKNYQYDVYMITGIRR